MKPDDEASQRQIQKPVHEGAGFPLAAQEDEELNPGLGLQDVRETKDSEPNDGKDFNRSLHPLLRVIQQFCYRWANQEGDPMPRALSPRSCANAAAASRCCVST